MLVDSNHRLTDALGIVNVPTVAWIDADGALVRPNDIQFPDDKFVAAHGIESAPHLDALRSWVLDDEPPLDGDDPRAHLSPRTPADQRARAHWRLAIELHRHGIVEAAESQFRLAGELAPNNWTIRRGSLPLRGGDPFGAEFLEIWNEWEAAARPAYYPGMAD